MKHSLALLAIFSSFLLSCASITPPTPDPSPQPVPEQIDGFYVINQLGENGKPIRTWGVTNYRHTLFPRSVSFIDGQGQPVTLTGSFEIIKNP